MIIDFVITTMDRYDRLAELLDSIFQFYPESKITVADQSKIINHQFYKKYKIDLIILEHDCGLSFARNELIKKTKHSKNKYILLLEDDFIFTKKTKIENLLELTDRGDIIGGAVREVGQKHRVFFEFNFEKKGDVLYHTEDHDKFEKKRNITYKRTQCILNFFLAKKEVFEKILWNEKLKISEHQHFFYRIARDTEYTVLFTPSVEILHNKTQNPENFQKLRKRQEFNSIFLEDLGFKKVVFLSGVVITSNN